MLVGMGRRETTKVLDITMDMKNRLTKIFGITDGATPEEASRKSSVEFVRGRAQLSIGGCTKGRRKGT